MNSSDERRQQSMYSILRRATSLYMAFLCILGCGQRVNPVVQPTGQLKSLESARVSPPKVSPPVVVEPEVTQQSEPQTQLTAEPILQVNVSGAKSSKGVYFCALFDDAQKLEQRSDPVMAERFPATSADTVWKIDTLPPGEYSIAVFHDANENDVLDRHALGFPIEAYGFSRNARGKFGPPPYEQIKFTVGSDPQQLQIQIK